VARGKMGGVGVYRVCELILRLSLLCRMWRERERGNAMVWSTCLSISVFMMEFPGFWLVRVDYPWEAEWMMMVLMIEKGWIGKIFLSLQRWAFSAFTCTKILVFECVSHRKGVDIFCDTYGTRCLALSQAIYDPIDRDIMKSTLFNVYVSLSLSLSGPHTHRDIKKCILSLG